MITYYLDVKILLQFIGDGDEYKKFLQILKIILAIFNTVHAISDMNITYKFQDIWNVIKRVKACADRLTNKPTLFG